MAKVTVEAKVIGQKSGDQRTIEKITKKFEGQVFIESKNDDLLIYSHDAETQACLHQILFAFRSQKILVNKPKE